MKLINFLTLLFLFVFFSTCKPPQNSQIPTIGFVDAFQDETLAQARVGFFDALEKAGYSEKANTLQVIYRNAQGDLPTLNQAIDYCISQKVKLLAACPTLAVITAVKKTKHLPICSMVSTTPHFIGLTDKNGNPQPNHFGAHDGIAYIGTAVDYIKSVYPKVKRLGVIYNQAETQSINAYNLIKERCQKNNLEFIALPANNSSETQLITEALIAKNIDAFFALPDNVVFSSFEVIYKVCQNAQIPIFTSEEGLVKRGAAFAYGADMYQWGYQAGETAVKYLKTNQLVLEPIKSHRKVYNSEITQKYKMTIAADFTDVNPKISSKNETKEKKEDFQNFYLSAIMLGLGFSAMALGIFISMRIFDIPDITTDGSYTLGGVLTAVLLLAKIPLFLTFLAVLAAGALAGVCTGFIHTRLKINALLAGILVMTALYSVNLSVLGRSNQPLNDTANLLNVWTLWDSNYLSQFSILLIINALLWLILSYLLKTDFGLAMRATGNSATMIRANGVNTDLMKTIGLAIANALVAFSGFLIVQYQGFADINMGIGIVIIGLGSVMIGENLSNLFKQNGIVYKILGVILGTVLFRLILALTLSLGINPNWLKFITALFVLLVVVIPNLTKRNK
jgi:putative ABC transport system permease protein